MRKEILRQKFPGLRDSHFQITSPPTYRYNCIAWAVGEPTQWWATESFPSGAHHWPEGAPREESVRGWIATFATLGYEPCQDGRLEPGYEKIAIFALDEATPKHVARQLPSGLWTSKLGTIEDIEHEIEGLIGVRYGEPTVYMRRPT